MKTLELNRMGLEQILEVESMLVDGGSSVAYDVGRCGRALVIAATHGVYGGVHAWFDFCINRIKNN